MISKIKKVKPYIYIHAAKLLIVISSLLPQTLFAQLQGGGNNPSGFINPLRFNSIQDFINAILNIVITIGIPISVFFIVYAGFLFVTAAGNEETIKRARSTFLWTVVGVAILLGASLLATILKDTINQIKS